MYNMMDDIITFLFFNCSGNQKSSDDILVLLFCLKYITFNDHFVLIEQLKRHPSLKYMTSLIIFIFLKISSFYLLTF